MDSFKDGDLVEHNSGKVLCYGGEISNSPSFCYVYGVTKEQDSLMVDLYFKLIICKDELRLMSSEEVENALTKILEGVE